MGMTHRDVMGREVGGGSCLGTHVRIKDFKIKKIKIKLKKKTEKLSKQMNSTQPPGEKIYFETKK